MHSQNFCNKRILFLTPSFFGYEKEIKKSLESEGATVDMFEERLSGSFIDSMLLRMHVHRFMNRKIERYFMDIFNSVKHNNYDYVWINNPEAITENLIKTLKNQCKNAKFILYMWDNFENKPMVPHLISYFDKVATFDKNDALKYNIMFLPLFYVEQYNNVEDKAVDIAYDISFVATAHSDRLYITNKIKKICDRKKIKYYFYLFLPNKFTYFVLRIIERGFRGARISDVKFSSLTHDQIKAIVHSSKTVLDIQHNKQSGLTMRTIEVSLGMRKKLITTNKDVQQYDFYNPDNICIIDREDIEIDESFIARDYVQLPDEVYKKYTLSNWLTTIFKE